MTRWIETGADNPGKAKPVPKRDKTAGQRKA
jgi:hypothetical protein